MDELTEGEQWARAELQRLLDRRFTPPAIAAFLHASQRRSNDVRRRHPERARRAAAWLTLGALAYVPARDRARRPAAWWAATALMLDWHLGMFETQQGEPRNLGPADALTLARAWMVPLAAREPTPALVLTAAATDVLDGIAARATQPTRAGRDLEGLVDACFGAAALHGAQRAHQLGATPARAELARLTAGFAFALAVYLGRAQPPPAAVIRAGRATTTARVAGLALAAQGHRRAGELLLLCGSAASVALLARAAAVSRPAGA